MQCVINDVLFKFSAMDAQNSLVPGVVDFEDHIVDLDIVASTILLPKTEPILLRYLSADIFVNSISEKISA